MTFERGQSLQLSGTVCQCRFVNSSCQVVGDCLFFAKQHNVSSSVNERISHWMAERQAVDMLGPGAHAPKSCQPPQKKINSG